MDKKSFMALRRLHGWLYEQSIEFKVYHAFRKAVKQSKKKSAKVERPKAGTEDYPVDFVVLWLDGSDPEWQKEKEKYMPQDVSVEKSNQVARFRNWDNFQYWFRGVEKYAPWVRNVYLVTCGHVPAFLNLSAPKLKFIRHSDFMPKEYLPTFSCFPTELNLWRIPGISEHIVYFNDDMFLTRPVEKEDFFSNGLPKYCAVAKPTFPTMYMTAWEHNLFNTAGVANDLFPVQQSIRDHLDKWFSPCYGNMLTYNMQAYKNGKIIGMCFSHLGVPYRCSTMKAVWEACPGRLDVTCRNKFRTMDDVMHQIFQMWEIFHGTYEPVSWHYYGRVHGVSDSMIDQICQEILSEDYRMICPNDWEGITEEEFPALKQQLNDAIEQKFPQKSSFEL